MLEYLVTSRARRELLKLLWVEKREASGRALAQLAEVSRSLADRELKAMESAGLAHSRVDGAAMLYRAATEHPGAGPLLALLESEGGVLDEPSTESDDRLRAALSRAGAPLLSESEAVDLESLEDAVVLGASLARRDPSVAAALPVLISRRRSDLDLAELALAARARGLRQEVGFFADLTAILGGGDKDLARLATNLRDRRVSRETPFFAGRQSRFRDQLMAMNTPEVARRWRYRMNMPLEDFQAFYDKHTRI